MSDGSYQQRIGIGASEPTREIGHGMGNIMWFRWHMLRARYRDPVVPIAASKVFTGHCV